MLSQTAASDPATVVEVRMDCFPADGTAAHANCDRPLLCVRLSDQTLVVYRAFSSSSQGIKYAKLPLDLPLLQGTSEAPLLHRFDGLLNADAELPRARAYRCGMVFTKHLLFCCIG